MSKQFVNMNANGNETPNPWYKRLIYIAVALVLAAGVFYFAGFSPAWEKVKALQAEQQEKENFLQKTGEVLQLKRSETAQSGQQNSSTADQLPQTALPATPDQKGILEDLDHAAANSGVHLIHVTFKPGETVGAEEGTDTNGGIEQVDLQSAGLVPLYFEVSINGNLAAIKSFTTSLQEEERLYAMKEFRYGTSADMPSDTTTIVMAAYYRLSDQD